MVGLAVLVVLAVIGFASVGSERTPRSGEVVVQSFAKIYVTNPGKWIVMVDYVSALPENDRAALRREAEALLPQLSGNLSGAGVDTAVLRAVVVKKWLIVTSKEPVSGFNAQRGPDGIWKLEP
jgi:hypothetical protein